jgi:poly(hydroxyalkanoate) depolymerase family esterase
MKADLKTAMLAAAQLTAAGDLHAATAAIRHALAGEQVAAPAAERAAYARDIPARMSRAADLIKVALSEGLPSMAPDTVMARAAPPVDERMTAGRFTSDAGSRDYLLYVPAMGRPTALVAMLHGCTQTAADFAAGTAMNEQADRHGFAVLYPAQSKAANRLACWNWFLPRDQRAGKGEPAIIAAMARQAAERLGVSPDRLFVAGLSSGGAMAAILGAAYPDVFSAVGVHSGLRAGAAHDLESAMAAMKRGAAAGGPVLRQGPTATARRPLRTIVFHGRQDRTVHPANGRQVAEVALAAFPDGVLASRQESGRSDGGRSFVRTTHVDPRGVPMVELWEVQGAGHAWSGGDRSGSHTDPMGPDASAAMAAFFLADR